MQIAETNIEFVNSGFGVFASPPHVIVSFRIDLTTSQSLAVPIHTSRGNAQGVGYRPQGLDLHAPIAEWLRKNKHLLSDTAIPQAMGQRKLLIP